MLSKLMGQKCAIAAVAVWILLAGCTANEPEESGTIPPFASTSSMTPAPKLTADVRPDRETKVDAGPFTVTLPEGAVRTTAHLNVSWSTSSVPIGIGNVNAVARITMTLDGMQPLRPVTIEYRLGDALASGEEAVVVRGAADVGPVTPLATKVSSDRHKITATTDHFSDIDVLIGQLTESIATVFSTRGDSPKCDGAPPKWVRDVVLPDQVLDPPLLACVGQDPRANNLLVIKLTNNRPTGLSVTANVDWAWQWVDAPGLVKFTAEDWLSNLSDPDAKRTIYVMPGQQLHLGFAKPAKPQSTTIELVGSVSSSALGYGVAWQALDQIDMPKGAKAAMAGAMASICLADAAGGPLRAAGADDIGPIINNLTQCAISNYDDVLTLARTALTRDAWMKIRPIIAGEDRKRIFRRLNFIGTMAGGGFQIAELVSSVSLDKYSRTISVFPKIDQPNLTMLEPGRLGPISVGMSGAKLEKLGYVTKDPDEMCGERWTETPKLTGRGIYLVFGAGSLDDLDEIIIAQFNGQGPSKVKTRKGIRHGSTAAEVRTAYPTAQYTTYQAEGGPYRAAVIFDPSGFAIQFSVGSPKRPNGRVSYMSTAAGSNLDNFAPDPGGC